MFYHQRIWLLVLLTILAVVVVYWLAPAIPQDTGYLDFADTRTFLGIPRVGDVLSNAPFTLVGLAGLGALYLGWFGAPAAEYYARAPYGVFFAGLVLLGPASGYFHWDPSVATLFWDRVFLTVAFMGLVSAVIADRIHTGWRFPWGLALLVALGFWSVLSWSLGEARGEGDLRLYILVQFWPLAAIPLILWLFPQGTRVQWPYIAFAIGIYAVAKVAELFDGEIFTLLGGAISGHSLKHLLAALGPVVIIAMMRHWPRRAGERPAG